MARNATYDNFDHQFIDNERMRGRPAPLGILRPQERRSPHYQSQIMGRVMEDDRMRGYDSQIEEFMHRFAYHVEDAFRSLENRYSEAFTMLNQKYEREISELQNEVETLTERLDSVEYYSEDLPEAA